MPSTNSTTNHAEANDSQEEDQIQELVGHVTKTIKILEVVKSMALDGIRVPIWMNLSVPGKAVVEAGVKENVPENYDEESSVASIVICGKNPYKAIAAPFWKGSLNPIELLETLIKGGAMPPQSAVIVAAKAFCDNAAYGAPIAERLFGDSPFKQSSNGAPIAERLFGDSPFKQSSIGDFTDTMKRRRHQW